MTDVRLALYKGPPSGGGQRQIAHHVTRGVMTIRDGEFCPWSHVELVIGSLCYSSSAMDVMRDGPRQGKRGGMRVKAIDVDSGRWDVYPIAQDSSRTPDACRARFVARQAVSQGYDWPAGAYWALPFIHPRQRADNCLEAVAHSLGHPAPSNVTFRGLLMWACVFDEQKR